MSLRTERGVRWFKFVLWTVVGVFVVKALFAFGHQNPADKLALAFLYLFVGTVVFGGVAFALGWLTASDAHSGREAEHRRRNPSTAAATPNAEAPTTSGVANKALPRHVTDPNRSVGTSHVLAEPADHSTRDSGVVVQEFEERRVYAQIAEEVELGKQDRGLWMKALVEAQGDPTKQVVLYAQLRMQEERERYEAELARREAQAREALETDETKKLRERLAALPGHHGPVELLKEFEFNNLVEQMIQQGTELNLPLTAAGDTLLHIAARANYYNAVGQLLKRGAWIAAKNGDGKTPLDLAEQHDSAFAASLLMEAVRKNDVAREKATKQLKSPVSIADYCARHDVTERDVRAMINAGNLRAYVWSGHLFVETSASAPSAQET